MRTALATLLVALVASVVPAGAQLIDRILAVGSRQYSTRSSIANCS